MSLRSYVIDSIRTILGSLAAPSQVFTRTIPGSLAALSQILKGCVILARARILAGVLGFGRAWACF